MMLWLLDAFLAADEAVSRCFVVRLISGAILDSLFGRPDELDYVSTTTPPSPPKFS